MSAVDLDDGEIVAAHIRRCDGCDLCSIITRHLVESMTDEERAAVREQLRAAGVSDAMLKAALERTKQAQLRRDVQVYGFSVELDGKRVDPREINWDPKSRVYVLPGGIELDFKTSEERGDVTAFGVLSPAEASAGPAFDRDQTIRPDGVPQTREGTTREIETRREPAGVTAGTSPAHPVRGPVRSAEPDGVEPATVPADGLETGGKEGRAARGDAPEAHDHQALFTDCGCTPWSACFSHGGPA